MNMRRVALAAILLFVPSAVMAADYRVEAVAGAPPAADLSPEIAALLSPGGVKVIMGEKRVVCEIWPTKQWSVKADFKPTDSVIYPLEVGQLIGVLRFARKGADFRGQEIPAGVYTLRYGNQPVDGNHVGTFETRDFLLMLPARVDQSAQPIAEMDLFKTSAQSAESSHPAIMPLVKPEEGTAPAVRHVEGHDWWAVRIAGNTAKGGKLPLELIVAGKAD